VFEIRSNEPERIDTGDYTEEEYRTFLREIRFINRWIGDRWALKKTLLKEIEESGVSEFSVLDVGAGSGELLKEIALFARKANRKARLVGLDLNPLSAESIGSEGERFREINSIQGDALNLPFPDDIFDYAICSLFTHHFTDDGVVNILQEMKRVSRRGIIVIDLERDRNAYFWYKVFCAAFRISELVRHDGLLSITKGFQPDELSKLGRSAELDNVVTGKSFPGRVTLTARI
jgi:ubiquinone/menaquinone biosynthesis C-methylase UbiE